MPAPHVVVEPMQELVAASHVIPVPQLPTVWATQVVPSQTIGATQVVVEATQAVPSHVMPAPHVVVEPMQELVAASHVIPVPQLPTVWATQVVPFQTIGDVQVAGSLQATPSHTIGAAQLPAVGWMQPPKPSETIGAVQVLVEAMQATPSQYMPAPQVVVVEPMQVLVAGSHVIPVPQLPTVCATQVVPSHTIGATQVLVEAMQATPSQYMPAPQVVVVEPMQVLVAGSHVIPVPQLPTVCATQAVPSQTIGATQLPPVPVPQKLLAAVGVQVVPPPLHVRAVPPAVMQALYWQATSPAAHVDPPGIGSKLP